MLRAYFSYVPMGLSVRFLDLSSGNPVSYAWDFGTKVTVTVPGGAHVLISAKIDPIWANLFVSTIADVGGSLGGTHFLISTPTEQFYVWFDTGSSVDPLIIGSTGIPVAILPDSTAGDIALAIMSAMDATLSFTTSAGATPEEIYILSTTAGPVADPLPETSGFITQLLVQGVVEVAEVWGTAPDTYLTEQLTSTDKEPIITFPESGVYLVTLTVTDAGGNTSSLTLPVGASDYFSFPALPTLILDAVLSRLPVSLLPPIPVIDGFLKKWQLYLADLIDPHIVNPNMFDETKWPALVNDLIVNLILYDIITDKILAGGAAAASGSGSGGGGLKKVVTGPAEAEWFGAADAGAAIMKAGGLYDQIKQRICIMSRRLRIPLEFCKDLEWTVRAPQVMKTHHHGMDRDAGRNNDYIDLHTNPHNVHDNNEHA